MNEKSPQALTQAQAVRVECLRIVYRLDKDPQTNIERAAELEAYVVSGRPAGKKDKPAVDQQAPAGPDLTQQS